MRTMFTTFAYQRSHGQSPRGVGLWAFQRSSGLSAFDRQLVGEIKFAPECTLTEAKAWARQQFPQGVILAVLP